jgi:hypothetical protein
VADVVLDRYAAALGVRGHARTPAAARLARPA